MTRRAQPLVQRLRPIAVGLFVATFGWISVVLLAAGTGVTADASPSATTSPTCYVETNGRRLAYRSIGDGPPVVLCNRFRGNLDAWDPAFLDGLARSFRVITFDYSGLGRSTGRPSYQVPHLAQDATDLLAALGIRRCVLLGWSIGGMAAQWVTLQHPELVSHCVLIGTTPPGRNEYPSEASFVPTALKAVNDLADVETLFFEPASAESRGAARRSEERMATRTDDRDLPIDAVLAGKLLQERHAEDLFPDPLGLRARLASTTVPLLVLSGDHEIVFPVENWYALTRRLPTVELHVFPQAGHGPQHQYPEACAQYITTFVRTRGR